MIDKIKTLWYIMFKLVCAKWGGVIKKLKRKRKEWLNKKNNKLMRKRTIRNTRRRRNIGVSSYQSGFSEYAIIKDNKYQAIAPEKLSICDNCEQTINYFNGIFDDMNRKHFGREYFFDVSGVKQLTNDAIMYILAIVHCIKMNRMFRFSFSGNMPLDLKAKQLFQESGFLNYVNSIESNLPKSSEKLQIMSGRKVDGMAAGKIIDFVSTFLNSSENIHKLKALYRVLVELMSNTINHAYRDDDEIMKKNWYVFAEKARDRIKFVFLDTGRGIPATIRKRGLEHFGTKSDEELIRSAFTQSERSQTKQTNRGYGLPGTYKICKASLLSDFTVISGKGWCKINADGDLPEPLCSKLYGTMYHWEIG